MVSRPPRCWFYPLWYLHDQSLRKCRSKVLEFVGPVRNIKSNPVYNINKASGPIGGWHRRLLLTSISLTGRKFGIFLRQKETGYLHSLSLPPLPWPRTNFSEWSTFPLCKHHKSFQQAMLITVYTTLWHLLPVKTGFFPFVKAPGLYEYPFQAECLKAELLRSQLDGYNKHVT